MDWLSKLFGGISNAASGAGRSIGSAVGGAGKAIGGFFNPAGAASNVGSSIGKNVMNMFGQSSPKMQSPMGSMPRLGGQIGQGSMPFQPSYGMMPRMDASEAPVNAQKQGGIGKSLWDMFNPMTSKGQIGAGIGANVLGQFLSPKVSQPDFGQSSNYQALNQFKGATLPPNVEALINRNVDIQNRQEMKRLTDTYKNVRPGSDLTVDSTYQRDLAELERRQTLNRSDAQAQALGQFNQQEISRLSELAQADIFEIMAKTGMEAEEANNFKQTFSNIGSMFLQKGLGLGSEGILEQFLRPKVAA